MRETRSCERVGDLAVHRTFVLKKPVVERNRLRTIRKLVLKRRTRDRELEEEVRQRDSLLKKIKADPAVDPLDEDVDIRRQTELQVTKLQEHLTELQQQKSDLFVKLKRVLTLAAEKQKAERQRKQQQEQQQHQQQLQQHHMHQQPSHLQAQAHHGNVHHMQAQHHPASPHMRGGGPARYGDVPSPSTYRQQDVRRDARNVAAERPPYHGHHGQRGPSPVAGSPGARPVALSGSGGSDGGGGRGWRRTQPYEGHGRGRGHTGRGGSWQRGGW